MLHAGGWKKGKRGSAANLSRCLAARRRRGRSQRVRNSRGNCRPSATWARVRLRLPAIGWPRSCSGCANSARSRAALSPSSIAGVRSERYPEIAAEFVRLKVDVITTQSTLAVLAPPMLLRRSIDRKAPQVGVRAIRPEVITTSHPSRPPSFTWTWSVGTNG
jgi:hypothetical protein